MKDLENEITAYALKNAIEFGKADAGRILPKLFQHGLEKDEIKEIMPVIQSSVKKINSMKPEERAKLFSEYEKYVKVKEEKEKDLPELPHAGKKMVFRLAPYPSGALHIGNAKTYLINALYAEKYNAKILFVIDDTIGSEEKQIAKEAYKLIPEAFDWLKVKYEKPIIYKSDRLEIYYKYGEELIKKGKAYVDFTPSEKMREMRAKGIESPDRQFPLKIQLERWKEMFKLKEGEAVLRIKTSMTHPNPAFRDRVLFKITDRKHPRVGTKYRVWPTLEMSWAIDDHLLGITHIIRGNDLRIETDMEKYIWDIFKWKHPEIIHVSLVKLDGVGAKISKSKAQKEVKSGEFIGWDDPRTWSIQSLKRRGFNPEAIKEFVKEIGLNTQDITVPIDILYAINRRMIDAESNRYSFIQDPIELKIKNKLDTREVFVPIHPDKKDMRQLLIDKLFASKADLEKYKGKETRLIHLYNIKVESKDGSAKVTTIDNKDIHKINWVSDFVETRILMPDGTWIEGIAESSIKELKNGERIQFERFGFARFDNKRSENEKGIYEFWFAHK